MSLVYEIVNNFGCRVLFVEKEGTAKALCLSDKQDLFYRPVYVAEDLNAAEMALKQLREEARLSGI